MSIDEFIISAFCLIDDAFKQLQLPKLCSRGKLPELLDSEVITMEIVGEFLEEIVGSHSNVDAKYMKGA